MQIKAIAMMVAAGCAMGLMTGCGVPQEDHDAIVAEMDAKFKKSEAELNGKLADQDSLLKAEKAKVRTSRIELDDATEQIKVFKQQAATAAAALTEEKAKVLQLEGALAAAKAATAVAQDLATEAESKYNTLGIEHQELKRRFEMFEKNMKSLTQAPAPAAAPSTAPAAQAPAPAKSSSAMGILDMMSIQ